MARAPYGKEEGKEWSASADYQAALDAMAVTDVNKRWQAEMSEFFVADGLPDQSFQRIPEIFHLD
jgi:L-rhamnose mutarotase